MHGPLYNTRRWRSVDGVMSPAETRPRARGSTGGALQPEGRVDRRRPRRRRSRGPRRRGAVRGRLLHSMLPPERAEERVARLVAEQFYVRADLSPQKKEQGSQPKGARDGQRAAAQALQGMLGLPLLGISGSFGHGPHAASAPPETRVCRSPLVDQLVRIFGLCRPRTYGRTQKDLQS